jgi:hypothetical protein
VDYPRLLADFDDVGRALARRSVEMEGGWESFQQVRRQLRRHMSRLKAGGTVHTAYLELLQRTAGNFNEDQLKRAVRSWTYWKQRYNAERHIRTQVAAAYRANQLKADRSNPWITGYRVRMNRATHAKWLKTKPGKLTKFGRRH